MIRETPCRAPHTQENDACFLEVDVLGGVSPTPPNAEFPPSVLPTLVQGRNGGRDLDEAARKSALGAELERSSARASAVKERAAARPCRLLGEERLLAAGVSCGGG